MLHKNQHALAKTSSHGPREIHHWGPLKEGEFVFAILRLVA